MRFSLLGVFTLICLLVCASSWGDTKNPTSPNDRTGLTEGTNYKKELEIDRVDVIGARVLTQDLIESALEIGPGDVFDADKVLRSQQNLEALYQRRGYGNAKIQGRLVKKKAPSDQFETVLEFRIEEGNPIKIAEVILYSVGTLDEFTKRFWDTYYKKLKTLLGVSPLKILDQDRVLEGRREIQEFLAGEGFISAKVEDIKMAEVKGPDAKFQWVNLEVKIDLGERIGFGFRGNTLFTNSYLKSLIQEQRTSGLGKDFAQTVRNRILEVYAASGYPLTQVTIITLEDTFEHERRVTYIINEGPKLKFDKIDFDGNLVFSDEQLLAHFYSKASGLVNHHVYVEKDIQKASELLIDWLKEQGYLSAKLVAVNRMIGQKSNIARNEQAARILIYIFEGDQTNVRNIRFQGNTAVSSDEIKNILKVKEGQPLNLFAFGQGLDLLKKIYKDKGYLDIKIVNEGKEDLVQYSQENRVADVDIEVEEGQQFRVNQIVIEGIHTTKEKTVSRELTLKSGDVLSESQLVQNEIQLRKLGIFSGINIRLLDDPSRSGYKNIRIAVQEADRGSLTWGPGIRNDMGVRLFGQLAYSNLWGENQSIVFNFATNRRFYNYHFIEAQSQLGYSWPWFGMSGLTFRPSLSAGRTQYFSFAADNFTLSLAWDKPLVKSLKLVGTFGYTLESIRQFNASVNQSDNAKLTIGTVTPRLSIDLRDNPLAPKSGFYSTGWFDLVTSQLGTQSGLAYYRAQFRSDFHIPIWHDLTFYFSFRTGFEHSFTEAGPNQDAIPLIKQFALGGIGSLRGYQEQEFNIKNTVYFTNLFLSRILAYTNYRAQVDLPVSGSLKVGLFVDAANLNTVSYSLGNLRYGTGFGFHYQTPVGAVNFDWGFKMNPPPGADAYVTHFSIGVI